MKLLILCFLTLSCSHFKSKPTPVEEDLVSVGAALDQAYASYLKGCVDTFIEMKAGPSFPHCREKAKAHYKELDGIMKSDVGH